MIRASLNSPDLTDKNPDDNNDTSNPTIGYQGGASYRTVYLDDEGKVVQTAAAAVKSYRLVSVQRQPLRTAAGGPSLLLFDAQNGRGSVRLIVEGSALRNGNVISTVRLEEELELVPKCCGVSFGGAHGNTDYEPRPDSQGESVCISESWGFMAGLANDGTGSMTINGVTTIVNGAGQTVNPLLCVQACDFNPTSTDFTMQLVSPFSIPQVRQNPDETLAEMGTISGNTDLAEFSNSGSSNSFIYCTEAEGTASGRLRSCPGGKVTINANAPKEPFSNSPPVIPYCAVMDYAVKPEGSEALHCNLKQLDYSGLAVTIAGTGSRALRLYFPGSEVNNVVRSTGGGELKHDGDSADFALFGCRPIPSCDTQIVKLAGSADGLNLFAWFPNGTVTISGSSSYEGVVWANEIISNGGVDWTIPSGDVQNVLSLAGFEAQGVLTPPLSSTGWLARCVPSAGWGCDAQKTSSVNTTAQARFHPGRDSDCGGGDGRRHHRQHRAVQSGHPPRVTE
ncbi:hypothetical protein [Synechococcus sp. CBW1004]|uniref:hypothetical protein n=1 Tax=Synechococcus sp. CBW1004 TaxID=1353136 RepID=UPI0018CDF9AE|nr:hypothetical protein [Synechococcus sp. CBW1004]QPN64740.1 hypothetical protein H8F25_08630 [Synechococcus sp. CBW1004]